MERRTFMKALGVGAFTAYNFSMLEARENLESINAKIAIIGAGLGGISLSAQLIKDMPNAEITLFDEDEIFYYQPGFTLIAAGIYEKSDVLYDKNELINKKVKWVREYVKNIDPEAKTLTTQSDKIFDFDYVVIATGVLYEFESVRGLSEELIKDEGSNITTIYTADGAKKAHRLMQEMLANNGMAVFAEPNTSIKCGGANKKVNFLLSDLSAKKNKNVQTHLYTGNAAMLSSPVHAKMIEQFYIQRGMPYSMRHVLVEVDTKNNIAVFDKLMPYTQDGIQKVAKEQVEAKFDALFMIPKMKAPDFLSNLSEVSLNFVNVDKYTLQHKNYPFIFAIGDVAGVPKGKTGASIRKQYPVIAKNIIHQIKGEELSAKFDGYTACPLLTGYGKAVMVEFDYEGASPSLQCFGETRESWLNWFVKIYLMKPMVMKGMIYARA